MITVAAFGRLFFGTIDGHLIVAKWTKMADSVFLAVKLYNYINGLKGIEIRQWTLFHGSSTSCVEDP